MSTRAPTPLVYSCSGASSAAQMANHLALRLDRLGVTEMSCIAGVGGDVPSLVRTACSGRPILALDGCPLHCAARILERHGIRPAWHLDPSEHGVPKTEARRLRPGPGGRHVEDALRAGARHRPGFRYGTGTGRTHGRFLRAGETRPGCAGRPTPPCSQPMNPKKPRGTKHAAGTGIGRPPKRFQEFARRYPQIATAYESLAGATQAAGPLDVRTRCLVKLAIAAGAWREGAVHSHARRALAAGCTPEELRHVVLLATTTLGFPSMMAVMTWVEDVLSGPSA